MTYSNHIVKLLIVAFVAAIATVILPYIFSIAFPSGIVAFVDGGPAPQVSPGTAHTMEELEKAARAAEERVRQRGNGAPQPRQISMAVRNSFWWITWIPWLAAPFFVKIRLRSSDLIFALSPLLLLVMMAWIQPVEALLSGASLLVGIILAYLKNSKRTDNSKGPGVN